MVFRVAADQVSQGPEGPKGPLARVDSSGARGDDAVHGWRGNDGTDGGGDGMRGGDAGPASAGANAGPIRVSLESAGGFIARLVGHYLDGRGERVNVNESIDFEREGQVELVANGGAGGNGGRGGDGGDGGRGYAGHDATRYSAGGDGGPGGDGGDGGNGSSGARGGDGGAITVCVSERDTHLVLLVNTECLGGRGGRAGSNGNGGSGGAGGRGGRSYEWTEIETYTDSQGQTQTRTTYNSNPGGNSGPSGSPGRPGYATLSDGAAGRPGSFAIEVVGDDGRVQSYPSRYELQVVGFQHDNDNRDGVYEPDEKVSVTRIAVKNVGAMPTPKHHDVVIGVVEKGWVDADESQTLTLPRAIAPGETHVFERESLTLKLQGHAPTAPGAPLAERETIHLFCALPAANRQFGAFESTLDPKTGQIVVQFPVEVSAIESLYSLAQGQATRVRFRLSNIALSALGRASEGGRELALRWKLQGGELCDGEVITVDGDGARARLDVGWHSVIERIDARSEQVFELVVAVAEDVRPYTSARFVLSAELAYIDDPRNARPVHLRELVIRVGTPFSRQAADVLLLVNNRTDREELAAWQRLCDELSLTHTIWDVSLEGGVHVLGADARYSLAIVLDYAMDSAAGECRAHALVSNVRAHALAPQCSAMYVGDSSVIADNVLEARGAETSEPVYKWYWWPWSEPECNELAAVAKERSAKAAALRPDERSAVVYRYSPALEKKLLWGRKMKLGTLEDARALGPSAPSMSTVSIDAISAHSPLTINEDATLAAVLAALPFDKKLGILKTCAIPFGQRTIAVDGGVSDVVVASVVDDLCYELASVLVTGWKSGVSTKELRAKMPLLAALDESQREGVVSLESDEGKRLIELCVWIELLASEGSRWWEWLPGAWGFRRGPAVRSLLRSVRETIVTRRTDSDALQKEFVSAIKKRRAEVEARWKALGEGGAKSEGLSWVRTVLDQRFGERGRKDARGALAPDERVIEGGAFDAMVAREAERERVAEAFVTLAREAKSDLLVDEGFAAIAAKAERIRASELRALAEGADAPLISGQNQSRSLLGQ
jgi:hypothetical protein